MSHPFGTFVPEHHLGRVYVEVGYQLFSDPDTVRGPDVSFVSRTRQTTAKRRRGFIHGVPDLAIEIASADKPMTQLAAKAVEYIAAGTFLVLGRGPHAAQGAGASAGSAGGHLVRGGRARRCGRPARIHLAPVASVRGARRLGMRG